MERDEFHRLRTGYLRLRSAVRDGTTGLFSYAVHLDEIRSLLAARPRVGVLWASLGDRSFVEAVYGWEAYDELLGEAASFLVAARNGHLPPGSIVAIAGIYADAFTIFVPADHAGRELDNSSLSLLAFEIEAALDDALSRTPIGLSPTPSGVRVGAALLIDSPFQRFERRVYLALDEARVLAERPREATQLAWLAELQRVMPERDLDADPSERLTVEGSVNKPGVFPISGRTTLVQVIAMAGGLDKVADENDVKIFRDRADGTRETIQYDLEPIRQGAVNDPFLMANDMVVVGKSSGRATFNDAMETLRSISIFGMFF